MSGFQPLAELSVADVHPLRCQLLRPESSRVKAKPLPTYLRSPARGGVTGQFIAEGTATHRCAVARVWIPLPGPARHAKPEPLGLG
jgi:hypothetical protein